MPTLPLRSYPKALALVAAFILLTAMRPLRTSTTADAIARPSSSDASATARDPSAQGDLAGTWNATYGTPGGTRPFTLILLVDGTTLTGTVRRPTEDSPLTGTIAGDSISFSYAITYNGHPLVLSIAAKVTGETMAGTVDIGGQAQEPFEAKKAK